MGGNQSSKIVAKKPSTHTVCRNNNQNGHVLYLVSNNRPIYRSYVPDSLTNWESEYKDYSPIEFTSPHVLSRPAWADPVDPWEVFNWNKMTEYDRTSHMGIYEVINGRPRNPVGRTGVKGRGKLGRWGVNHAADPIVTRWKLDKNGKKEKHPITKQFILQFVAIKRSDTGEWAIPGGMCDPGEKVSKTLKREFMEEATDSLTQKKLNKEVEKRFDNFFKQGQEIYRGYVDDPRNTDNSWMETVVYNFHDEKGTVFKNYELKAGDDATSVKWMDIDGEELRLYASHKDFIEKVTLKHKAHWKSKSNKIVVTKKK